jgi:hypothetical protein
VIPVGGGYDCDLLELMIGSKCVANECKEPHHFMLRGRPSPHANQMTLLNNNTKISDIITLLSEV